MDEGAHALRAAAAMTQARTPAKAAEAQFSYAMGWWSRAAAHAITLNGELMKAQAEALAPIARAADELAGIRRHTGREGPDVVT